MHEYSRESLLFIGEFLQGRLLSSVRKVVAEVS